MAYELQLAENIFDPSLYDLDYDQPEFEPELDFEPEPKPRRRKAASADADSGFLIAALVGAGLWAFSQKRKFGLWPWELKKLQGRVRLAQAADAASVAPLQNRQVVSQDGTYITGFWTQKRAPHSMSDSVPVMTVLNSDLVRLRIPAISQERVGFINAGNVGDYRLISDRPAPLPPRQVVRQSSGLTDILNALSQHFSKK